MTAPEQLSIHEAKEALATRAEPSIGQMLATFLENPEAIKNVEVAERMFALYERAEARNAEKEFAAAFADLQTEMPRIEARGQSDRYSYMKYEDIMQILTPLLNKHGFSVTFSTKAEDTRLTQFCTVTHRNGHSRTNQYTVRLSNRTPGLNECQQDGLAGTYAKRYAVCNAFNITVETDTDGREDVRNEGAFITVEKSEYLREQVREVKFNEATFFKLAGCSKYEEITEGKYAVLINALDMKRRQA